MRRRHAPLTGTHPGRRWLRRLVKTRPLASPRLVLPAFALACCVAALPSLAACRHEQHSAPPPSLPAQAVEIARARETSRPIGDQVVGTVRARSEAAVSASVTGTVRVMRVSVGSRVKAGDLLVQLSAGEIAAKADQARALLSQAKLRFDRAAQLKSSQSIAPAEYDAAESQLQIAKAGLTEAEVMLGYLVVRAPIAGVVTSKRCDVGDLALAGHPLVTIESPGALRLEAGVPEAIAHQVEVGKKLSVRVDTLARDLEAVVDEVSPSSDPLSRTVLVKLALPAEKDLRAGMFGRLLVPTGEARALEVPKAALVRRGQLELLYVVEGGKAGLRLVRAGREHEAAVDVLSGLSSGEAVVVAGLGGLVDGQPVVVKP